MTIYKLFQFLILGILLMGLTFLFYLYKQNRLIILFKKNSITKNDYTNLYQEKLYGTILTEEEEEKKIPFSISFDSFDKKHPENFIYTILYQYFHYFNIENIGEVSYDLYHVALNHQALIINGRLNKIKPQSPYKEFFFLKSIYLTIRNIFPFISQLYLYNEENPLLLNYTLPFFTQEMIEKQREIESLDNIQSLSNYEIILIPFLNSSGKSIAGILEKNIFQKNQNIVFFPKNKINSEEYFKEINQYQNTESSDKIICFITIQESNREQIDIISYPIIPEDLLIYQTKY